MPGHSTLICHFANSRSPDGFFFFPSDSYRWKSKLWLRVCLRVDKIIDRVAEDELSATFTIPGLSIFETEQSIVPIRPQSMYPNSS